MADYDLPNSADIQNAIPEFKDTDAAVILPVIAFAATFVGQSSWDPVDYRLGIIYLTAHFLSMMPEEDTSSDASAGGVEDANAYIRSVTIGDRTVTFGQRTSPISSSNSADDLSSTWYGQMFLLLRNRNAPKVAVV